MPIITTTKQMRPRDPQDFYPTPPNVIAAALARADSLLAFPPATIIDPGAGTGVWGIGAKRLWPCCNITGIELRDVEPPAIYDDWYQEDFRLWQRGVFGVDLVMGNPPYKHAEQFVRLGLGLLAHNGVMVYLLRLAFLEGQDRGRDLWAKYPPFLVEVCSERPSFTGDGHTDATAYALFYWRKGWKGKAELGWVK